MIKLYSKPTMKLMKLWYRNYNGDSKKHFIDSHRYQANKAKLPLHVSSVGVFIYSIHLRQRLIQLLFIRFNFIAIYIINVSIRILCVLPKIKSKEGNRRIVLSSVIVVSIDNLGFKDIRQHNPKPPTEEIERLKKEYRAQRRLAEWRQWAMKQMEEANEQKEASFDASIV